MEFRERQDKVFEDAISEKDIVPLRDLLAVPKVVPRDGDTWGNWTFRRATLTLEYRNPETFDDYEIDLENMHVSWALLTIQAQIDNKRFISAADIGNLFRAVHDLAGHPWYGRKANITESIGARLGAANSTHDSQQKAFAKCLDCGKPTSGGGLLCRQCYKRVGGPRAPIYQAARARGESSDRSSRRPKGVPPRAYHRRSDQVR